MAHIALMVSVLDRTPESHVTLGANREAPGTRGDRAFFPDFRGPAWIALRTGWLNAFPAGRLDSAFKGPVAFPEFGRRYTITWIAPHHGSDDDGTSGDSPRRGV